MIKKEENHDENYDDMKHLKDLIQNYFEYEGNVIGFVIFNFKIKETKYLILLMIFLIIKRFYLSSI